MNYKTLQVEYLLPEDKAMRYHDEKARKAYMAQELSHAIARKLLFDDIGTLDSEYDIVRMATKYRYSVRVLED